MAQMRLTRFVLYATLILSAACAACAACADRSRNANRSAGTQERADQRIEQRSDTTVDLLGAGASFPYPLYARWFNQFAADSGVRINYLSVGSGSGIDLLLADTVDFAASDVPLREDEADRAFGGRVVHVPMVLGAVALTYHLGSLTRPLRLSGTVIADIFSGRIGRWNHERLRALNPDQPLPDDTILVVHRSDASGTSFILSDYLSAISNTWASDHGRGREVSWSVGTGRSGNAGVAAQVRQTPGAIGYVESSYARLNRLPVARVQNASGAFVAPSPFEVGAAAVNVLDAIDEPADLRVSLVNASGKQSYPIVSFSWLLVAPQALDDAQRAQLMRFIDWALTDGEQLARELGYEPLPALLAERVMASTRTELFAPTRAGDTRLR